MGPFGGSSSFYQGTVIGDDERGLVESSRAGPSGSARPPKKGLAAVTEVHEGKLQDERQKSAVEVEVPLGPFGS